MTVPQPLARRVERMRDDLARVELAIGPAYTVLRAMASDGYSTGGGDGRGGDIYASSTATAALARFEDTHERILRRVKIIAAGLEDLADELVRTQKRGPDWINQAKAVKDNARCSGGVGHDGYLEWGRPDCDEMVGEHSTSGIGDACRKRRDRWQARRDMERSA